MFDVFQSLKRSVVRVYRDVVQMLDGYAPVVRRRVALPSKAADLVVLRCCGTTRTNRLPKTSVEEGGPAIVARYDLSDFLSRDPVHEMHDDSDRTEIVSRLLYSILAGRQDARNTQQNKMQ